MEEIKDLDSLFSELKTTTVKTGPEPDTKNGNLYDIAVEYYGEKYVDKIYKQCIIIHFPELEITSNGTDRSKHTIYDLYVMLDFIAGSIKGLRTSYVKKEILNFPVINYAHSHLSSGEQISMTQLMKFDKNFCLGSSELLNAFSFIKSEYKLKPNQKLDDNLYYYLFSNLDTYLVTENHRDGGGPYKRIAMIDRASVNNESIRASSTQIDFIARYFITNLCYYVIGNKIEFADTYENWKMFLAEEGYAGILLDMGEYDMSQGCGVSKTTGIASINLNHDWKMNCFKFKDQNVEFKIKDEINSNKDEINEIYPKKIIIDAVKRRFAYLCESIANTTIKNYSKENSNTCKYANGLVWQVMDASSFK